MYSMSVFSGCFGKILSRYELSQCSHTENRSGKLFSHLILGRFCLFPISCQFSCLFLLRSWMFQDSRWNWPAGELIKGGLPTSLPGTGSLVPPNTSDVSVPANRTCYFLARIPAWWREPRMLLFCKMGTGSQPLLPDDKNSGILLSLGIPFQIADLSL